MAAPPNFHCYFGHSSSYFPGARQPPGAAGEAARRGDTQRRAHGRGAGPTPARGGRRRGASSGSRRGAGETGHGAGATCPHLCTASPRPPPPSSRLCLRLTFPTAAAAAGEGRGGRRRGGVMRKHDRGAERAPRSAGAQPSRSRPGAASRGPRLRTCPAAPPPDRTGRPPPPWQLPDPARSRPPADPPPSTPPDTHLPRRGQPSALAWPQGAPPRPRRFPPSRVSWAARAGAPAKGAAPSPAPRHHGGARGKAQRPSRGRERSQPAPPRCCGRCGGMGK
ncbi:atherin-like isoform X2 [Heliangelus exortis]|uniref:atherin-like isoform X2 n=1 Tax=Heliangelus exortis TaxID=472823 RepID=UPI003A90C10C